MIYGADVDLQVSVTSRLMPDSRETGPHSSGAQDTLSDLAPIRRDEFLERGTDFRFADGQGERRVSFSPGAWRACDSLPITFTPR